MMLYSFTSIVVYIVMYFTVSPPRGAATQVVLQCLTLAILSLGIGILGEYIGAIYLEVKRRPIFIVQESMNIDLTQTQTRSDI
jgi:dolichol-phosphate mannosyltransferase